MTWAIRFEEVSKRYRGPGYASLRESLARLGRNFFRGRSRESGTLALNRISFEVEEGEAFGIVGPNGAGKTTALKLMARISYPSSGRIRVRGRLGALIEVGSGVHPELTGRENIWLYGRIMGLSRGEVGRRFDEIVDFSELENVLDKPVKMYSTGMQLRLGFSIASHLDPDVFVVDEALAVGDAVFQAKCVERMMRMVPEGKTLLFVSHQLTAVESLCKRALFLHNGHIAAMGEVKTVLKEYLNWSEQQRLERWHARSPATTSNALLEIVGATCHSASAQEGYEFTSDEPVEIRVRFRARRPIHNPHITVGITDGRPQMLILCSTLHRGEPPGLVEGEWTAACRIDKLNLLPRLYQVWCGVHTEHGHVGSPLTGWQEVALFRVVVSEGDKELNGKSAVTFESLHGAVKSDYQWDYRKS